MYVYICMVNIIRYKFLVYRSDLLTALRPSASFLRNLGDMSLPSCQNEKPRNIPRDPPTAPPITPKT